MAKKPLLSFCAFSRTFVSKPGILGLYDSTGNLISKYRFIYSADLTFHISTRVFIVNGRGDGEYVSGVNKGDTISFQQVPPVGMAAQGSYNPSPFFFKLKASIDILWTDSDGTRPFSWELKGDLFVLNKLIQSKKGIKCIGKAAGGIAGQVWAAVGCSPDPPKIPDCPNPPLLFSKAKLGVPKAAKKKAGKAAKPPKKSARKRKK